MKQLDPDALHAQWMRRAISVAESSVRSAGASGDLARNGDDVPIGAVVYDADGAEIAAACNERELLHDPTAHAEILALRAASTVVGSWRLLGCTLVVTLEPCTMCAGALVLSRVSRVIFGASDPKAGAVGSLWDVVRDPRLNHRPDVVGGVLADECGAMLKNFFAARRAR